MSIDPAVSPPGRARDLARAAGFALASALVLFTVAMRGLLDPLAILVVAPAAGALAWLTLARAPVVLFALVPVTMAAFIKRPFQAYDLLIVSLGALALLAALPRLRPAALRPDEVTLRFLVFIAALSTSLLLPIELRRFLYGVKLYLFGLLAFLVARYASSRFGREAVAWGVAAFSALTSAMLFARAATLGVPGFKSTDLRNFVAELPWGRSNYVAAALVLCVPLLFHLARRAAAPAGRWLAGALLALNLATLSVTLSRGGLLLSAAFFVGVAVRRRRPAWVPLLVLGGLAALLVLTPVGSIFAGRFTGTRGVDSAMIRGVMWAAAWQRGAEHLPFGIGHGQGLIQGDALAEADPHNFYLTLFSEGGPLALLLWLWLMAGLWRAAGRLAGADVRLALRATLLVAGANALFEPTFPGYLYQTLFWWIAGLLLGAGAATRGPQLREPSGDYAAP